MNNEMTSSTKPCTELSERERSALQLKADGKTNSEIATALSLGLTSVDKMFSNAEDPRAIYGKIGVKNQAEAVAWFVANCQEMARRKQIDEKILTSVELDTAQLDTMKLDTVPTLRPEHHANPLPWTFILLLAAMFVGLVGLTFLPAIVRGKSDPVDDVLLNLYALIAAISGVYGMGHFQGRPSFLRVFRLFSLGLLFWSLGGAIWTVYDVVIGLEPHYPSWADVGYMGQTLIQLVSFGLWWVIVTKRGALNTLLWLPIALALFILYCFALL